MTLAAHSNFGSVLIPLSFHPNLAVGEMLLFPDRYQALQAIDAFERRGERRFPMRRGDDDGHARLADLQASQAVRHANPADLEFTGDLASNISHHFDCHRLIAFVVEESR